MKDPPSVQHPGLEIQTQLSSPAAPGVSPITMAPVTQQVPSPPGEAEGLSSSPRSLGKRRLPAFTPEVTGNSPSGAMGQAGRGARAHLHPVATSHHHPSHHCLYHQGCKTQEPTLPCPMYRLVLAGDSGTGKSSFLLRLCTNEFRGDISSTLGSTPRTPLLPRAPCLQHPGTWMGQRHGSNTQLSLLAGVDFQIKQLLVDGEQTTLQIWDTAGQER